MRKIGVAGLVLAAAAAIWLAVFFGGAYAPVRLAEAKEGDISECDRAECGALGEFLDEHDLLGVIVLASLAALVSFAFGRQALRRAADKRGAVASERSGRAAERR